jgi:hypothetical protein
MSLKQDRTGTRNSEDLRRRLNVNAIAEATEKVDASVEQVNALNNQVTGLNNTINNTRNTYVSTNVQNFTEEQKELARQNIGAGTSSFSGSYEDLYSKPTIPTRISQLTNDSDFVEDYNYVHTDNNYTTTEKNKLTNIEANAQVNKIEGVYINGEELTPTNKKVNIYVDSSMSDYSENPVQNKVIKAYIDANSGGSSGGSSNAIYQEYHTDYAGYVWFNDGLLVQWGRTSVTPTAVNTDTTARITYTYSYDNIPDRKTEVSSATPTVAKVTSGGGTTTSLSKQGMNIYVNSTTTRAVTVDWLATGYKGT